MGFMLRKAWSLPVGSDRAEWETPLNQATQWIAEHFGDHRVAHFGPFATTYATDSADQTAFTFWIADGGRVTVGDPGSAHSVEITRTADQITAQVRGSSQVVTLQVTSPPRTQQNGWAYVCFSGWTTGLGVKKMNYKLDLGDGVRATRSGIGQLLSSETLGLGGKYVSLHNDQVGYLSWFHFASSWWLGWALLSVMFWWVGNLFDTETSIDLTPVLEARDTNCTYWALSAASPEVTGGGYMWHWPDKARSVRVWVIGGGQGGQGGQGGTGGGKNTGGLMGFSGTPGQRGKTFGPVVPSKRQVWCYLAAGGTGGAGGAGGAGSSTSMNGSQGRYGNFGAVAMPSQFDSASSGDGQVTDGVIKAGRRWFRHGLGVGGVGGSGGLGGSSGQQGSPGGRGGNGAAGGLVFYLQF